MANINFLLKSLRDLYQDDLLNVYSYGGQVYNVANKQSDFDYIAIFNNTVHTDHIELYKDNIKYDVSFYDKSVFEYMAKDNEITAMECLSLPEELVLLQTIPFELKIDLPKLRESIASKSSHSFVKARKKIRYGEYYIGRKSLWHSFRIIYFGIQLAKFGKIIDFSAANHLYADIVLSDNNDEEYYKNKYLKLHNELMTEFRKLAPK